MPDNLTNVYQERVKILVVVKNSWRSPGSNRSPLLNRTDQSQLLYRPSHISIVVRLARLYSFRVLL